MDGFHSPTHLSAKSTSYSAYPLGDACLNPDLVEIDPLWATAREAPPGIF